ncbi:biopolymer transporter ExbD [Myxococcota bacterium]|nr:biopolymer transporter ExbD [Myxococcota bacterium]
MAMSSGGGGGRGALSEINVTPLVDVMLVLLVVFMVTTPIIVEDMKPRKVEVDLPQTSSNTPLKPTDLKQLVATAGLDYKLTMEGDEGKEPIVLADCGTAASSGDFATCLQPLEDKLKANPKVQAEKKLFLQADRRLPYGFIVDVMAHARNAGITGLGMVTNPPGGAAAPVPAAASAP